MTDENLSIPTFKSADHPVLYHYCSTSTFLSIIQRRCMWLSDINTMNDYGEMHWAYRRFIVALNEISSVVGSRFMEETDEIVSATQLRILPMLASFSTDGDVLSQWRAYADDGRGVALGFDAKKMETLSIRIAPVEYEAEKQVENIKRHLLYVHSIWSRLPEAKQEDFLFNEVAYFGTDLAFYKNPAFSEEKEVRILRALVVNQKNGEWELSDNGGTGDRISRKKLPVHFRAAPNGGIIAYVELPLGGLGKDLIKEVIIGPKSQNGGPEISMALTASEYHGAKIVHSRATYR